MKKKCCAWIAVLFLLLCPGVRAGQKIGVAPGFGMMAVDDPDGDTETSLISVPFCVVAVYDLNHRTRVYSQLSYLDFELDADTDKVGQQVSVWGAAFTYQYLIKLSYSLQFYVGLGLDYSNAEFNGRHIIDNDGYLLTRYNDRKDSLFAGVINLSKEWELSRKYDLGVGISYQHALRDDGIDGLRGTLTLFYRIE